MIPASHIGKDNYNILGNQRVGETHRSRMKRVSQLKPMNYGLTNPNMGFAILPSRSGAVTDSVAYGLAGGIAGVLLAAMLEDGGNKLGDSKEGRTATAVAGAVAGVAASVAANSTRAEEPAPVVEDPFYRAMTGGGVVLLGLLGAGLAGLDWSEVAPSFQKGPAIVAGGIGAIVGIPILVGASPDTMTALHVGLASSAVGVGLAHRLLGSVN